MTRSITAERRHGTALTVSCNQCGTSWQYVPHEAQQCPDCYDHLGELIDPAHPDWCMRDVGCSLAAGHEGLCELKAALS